MANHDCNLWWWWLRWPEWCLQQGLLHLFQVRHPETLLSASNKWRSNGIFEHLVDAKVREDAGLIITNTQFLCNSARLIRHDQIALQSGSEDRKRSCLEIILPTKHCPHTVQRCPFHQSRTNNFHRGTYNAGHFCSRLARRAHLDRSDVFPDTTLPCSYAKKWGLQWKSKAVQHQI